jgi:hypothetical protein
MQEDPSVRYGGFGDSFWNKRENGSMLGVAIGKISYCLNREIEKSDHWRKTVYTQEDVDSINENLKGKKL